jgi:hypothetical protein
VQQDEQPVAVSLRHDEDLVQVAVGQPAVEREVHEPRSACGVVPGAVPAGDGQRDEDG